eukprot:scaffold115611_cov21-Tisochrysis_lutea.AAC.4
MVSTGQCKRCAEGRTGQKGKGAGRRRHPRQAVDSANSVLSAAGNTASFSAKTRSTCKPRTSNKAGCKGGGACKQSSQGVSSCLAPQRWMGFGCLASTDSLGQDRAAVCAKPIANSCQHSDAMTHHRVLLWMWDPGCCYHRNAMNPHMSPMEPCKLPAWRCPLSMSVVK